MLSSVAAVLVAGTVVAAIFSTGLLTPAPDPENAVERVAVPLRPNVPARLRSSGVNVDIPADAVGSDTRLTYTSMTSAEIPVLPAEVVWEI